MTISSALYAKAFLKESVCAASNRTVSHCEMRAAATARSMQFRATCVLRCAMHLPNAEWEWHDSSHFAFDTAARHLLRPP